MARLTDFELDVKKPQWTYIGAVSIRRDPRKSTMWSTWHAHKVARRDSHVIYRYRRRNINDLILCDLWDYSLLNVTSEYYVVIGKYAYITTFTSKYTGGNDARW